jgi:phosphoribosylamine--glycine ligase
MGADLEEARRKAYANVERIHFEGVHYRRDIGLVERSGVRV